MSETTRKNLRNIFAAVVALAAALLVLIFIPFAVDRTFEREVNNRVEKREESQKIVTGWRAERWKTDSNGVVTFDVYGEKGRGECKFVPDWTVSALATVDGKFQEVAVKFLKDVSPGSTRPAGLQFFGRWELTPPEGGTIEAGPIPVMTAHDCGGSKAEVHESGPFEYPG